LRSRVLVTSAFRKGRPNPCTAPVTTSPSGNTSSCYPVYWTPAGYTAPFLDWFNKYVVDSVTQTDPTGGAPPVVTSYKYKGGAAWHYDDNEIVKPKYRTYGQFRGYGDVQTLTGDGVNDPQTLAETTYYRGMSDDNNSTAVTLADSAGGSHNDANQLAGLPLEATSHLGNGGPVDHSTVTSYWVSAAARARSGLPDLTANWVAPAETYTRQALTGGGSSAWRYTETDTTYDASTTDADFGLPTHAYTHTVPVSAAYDQCTTTSYAAANTGANLVGLAAETEADSVACGGFTEGSPASVPAALNTLTATGQARRTPWPRDPGHRMRPLSGRGSRCAIRRRGRGDAGQRGGLAASQFFLTGMAGVSCGVRWVILLPSQTSGSYLRPTTRSFMGMSALSVILMFSGQTSVQHLVMLQ
jgi:hypothetical protein